MLNALAYILDGESDFEDLSVSDSDFEPDLSTAVVSSTKIVHDNNNANIPLHISESLTQESSTDDDMLCFNSSPPPKKIKNNKNKKSLRVLPLWKKVPLDNDLIGDITFQEVPIEPIPDETTTLYEYFKMFVDDNLIDILAEQSSLYSCQSSGTSICVTSNEIESFIGVYFCMGLVKLPSVRSYWENFMNYDGVSSVLSRNRFLSILRYLHFVDNLKVTDEVKKNDRAWKLRPWLEKLRENFLKVSPEENQSVDEIMVAFKGRSFLKQYVPNKPNKWGFKLWGRCGVSGYLYDFDLYQGKEIKKKDEYSPHDELKKRRIWYVGTARLKRLNKCSLPSEKELKKQGRGSFDYRTDTISNNIAVSWIDNKAVTLISSFASIEPINTVRRYDRKTRKYIMVKQPYIVQFYNKNMGGVDKLDMMCSFYKPNFKCHRWYVYIWAHTLLIALSNAWFLYRRDLKIICPTKKFMPLKKFQAAVASSLIAVVKSKAGRPSLDATPLPTKRPAAVQSNPTKDIRLDGFDHLPTYSDKRQRCKKCKTGFSYICCKKCNVWLCLIKDRNCFHDYN
ncbi:piggyBac transposable element-derived protein 3-like isoform X1 [Hydra vulgaris]|uniref:piggyBac transposable element-derived protein 3-like isoform X1 n=1 Tax=Hydra vulgaris TaxID=6087 RepID=UPI0032EA0065